MAGTVAGITDSLISNTASNDDAYCKILFDSNVSEVALADEALGVRMKIISAWRSRVCSVLIVCESRCYSTPPKNAVDPFEE